jgi:hypothetical protein
MRENQPYNIKKYVTEEEVESWKTFFKTVRVADVPLETASDFVERMWGEIQSLRASLEKQIY